MKRSSKDMHDPATERLFNIRTACHVLDRCQPGDSKETMQNHLRLMEGSSIDALMEYQKTELVPELLARARSAEKRGDGVLLSQCLKQLVSLQPYNDALEGLFRSAREHAGEREREALDLLQKNTRVAGLGLFSDVVMQATLAVVFSPDAETVVTSDFHGGLLHFFSAGGERIRTLSLGKNSVPMGLFQQEGESAFWCCDYGQSMLFKLDFSGETLHTLALSSENDARPSLGTIWGDKMVISMRDYPLQAVTGGLLTLDLAAAEKGDAKGLRWLEWPENKLPNAMAVLGGRLYVGTHRPVKMYAYDAEPDACPCPVSSSLPSDLRWLSAHGSHLYASCGNHLFKLDADGGMVYQVDLPDLLDAAAVIPTGFAFSPVDPEHCLLLDFNRGTVFSLRIP